MSADYFENSEVRSLLDQHLEKTNKGLYHKLHDSTSYYNGKSKRKKQLAVVKYLFESKKLRKIQENDLRKLLLNLGLVMSLGLVLLAFEWRTYNRPDLVELNGPVVSNDEIIEIPPTEQPPPEPPKTVIKHANIVEVPDVEEIKQDIILDLDLEVSEKTTIEKVIFPEVETTPEPVEEEKADEIFILVEEQPMPQGGFEAFYNYISENIKYPVQAKRMDISGKVFVQFVVEKNGRISSAQVVKGIGGGCDEEALRVVRENPIQWNPGKQRGHPVRTQMIIPIHFTLKKN